MPPIKLIIKKSFEIDYSWHNHTRFLAKFKLLAALEFLYRINYIPRTSYKEL
jgi:hypothetical protein